MGRTSDQGTRFAPQPCPGGRGRTPMAGRVQPAPQEHPGRRQDTGMAGGLLPPEAPLSVKDAAPPRQVRRLQQPGLLLPPGPS